MKHWRWILTLLFGLLVALASAQTFQRSLPFLAKGAAQPSVPFTPTDIQGAAYRWIGADPTNSPVTDWVDRIQGKNMTNATSGRRPLTNGLAVQFFGTNWLYMSPPVLRLFIKGSNSSTNDAYLIIQKHIKNVFTPSVMSASTESQNIPFFGYNDAGTPSTLRINGGDVAGTTDNQIQDILICPSAISSGSMYTNGVRLGDTGGGLSSTNFDGVGNLVSKGETAGWKAKCDIYEIVIWTNYTAQQFTTTQISNLHYYATNTYKFSP